MKTPDEDERELSESLAQLERESTGIAKLLCAADSLRGIAQRYTERGNIKRARELSWECEALMLTVGGQYRYPEAQDYLDSRIENIEGNPLWTSRLQRALVCLSSDYDTTMAYAQCCEQIITQFRRNDSPQDAVSAQNFAANAREDWLEVVHCYEEAMNVYLKYQKEGEVKALLTNLLQLAQTCDESTSGLALQLLLVLKDSLSRLEQIAPGTRDRTKVILRHAIDQKNLAHEMDFCLLALIRYDEHRSALELLRDLANDDEERCAVDVELCQTMQLAAQLCLSHSNIDGAEAWYREAAQIARDRLADTKWTGRLLKMASGMAQLGSQRPPSDLDTLLMKSAKEQHGDRFVPLPEQFVAEYASVDDQLAKLLADERLLLDKPTIAARAAKYHRQGLDGWLDSKFTDARRNPRGDYPPEAPFVEQYVIEVAGIIGALLGAWQECGTLLQQQITAMLQQTVPDYDQTILEVGLYRHFQSDFISSIHILVPRFEDFVFWCARRAEVSTKRLKSRVPGEALLGDILRPDNAQMSDLLGNPLLELAWNYMVNSAGPFNWRNKVAHGWIQASDCSAQLSAMVIYLTLQVATKAKGRDAV